MRTINAHKGFQEKFIRSNADITIGGGILGSGKTTAACIMQAEPLLDSNYRALMIRKNIGNLQAGGGLIDEIENIYGCIANIRKTSNPSAVFPSGARIDLTHVADEDRDTLIERAKGWQYDCIYFDELTAFDWQTFATIISRNRGKGKWTGKIRATCNPKKTHWLRTYLDWYIGPDGEIIPERDGVVRYVFAKGDGVEGLVFGNTKEEVYEQCKFEIDERIRKMGGEETMDYRDFILSTVFYKGNIKENTNTLGRDRTYLGKVSMMGKTIADINLGNWNIDPDEDVKAPIIQERAKACFTNDPMIGPERWITADIADFGTDNLVILAWYGLHVVDCLVVCHTTPAENVDYILMMAERHDVADGHIIYDATNARYINTDIPDAIPYLSAASSRGMYNRSANRLKDECYLRLCFLINAGMITIAPNVYQAKYPHIKIGTRDKIEYTPVSVEFLAECAVVRFYDMPGGKKRLFTKNEMNKMLGKGKSMDLLDPFAMMMLVYLEFRYGEEYDNKCVSNVYDEQETDDYNNINNIYELLAD